MKNFMLIFLLMVSISCSRTENVEEEIIKPPEKTEIIENIQGSWHLVKVESYLKIYDFSADNIIYNFQENNVLTVSGAKPPSFENGNYNYEYKMDYLSGYPSPTEPKLYMFKTLGLKYPVLYYPASSTLVLDGSYIDGPKYIFRKK